MLVTYDRGPGRRPDISLSGDDEDTADVIGEVLDDDEMQLASSQSRADRDTGGTDGDGAPLPSGSYAAFLRGLASARYIDVVSPFLIPRALA